MDWIGSSEAEQREMLAATGAASFDDLIAGVPERLDGLLDIPDGMPETQLLRHLQELAAANRPAAPGGCFIGAGAYEHAIPAAIDALIQRGEFLTAYTPYQPEASQGTLTAIFEFQSMIAAITGMDAANASMYDGASSMAEAALLAIRQTGRNRVAVSECMHPEWVAVLRTYLSGIEADVVVVEHSEGVTDADRVRAALGTESACLIVQHPNFFGRLEEMRLLADATHESGALFIVAANPISLGVLAPPGHAGADVVVGDCQPMGIPLNYGGPYAGFFAVRSAFLKQMPGRLAGMSYDGQGRRGFTLTLQTREQHIRRERATSNICTNQALIALASTIYMSLAGREGFREIARQNVLRAHHAADLLTGIKGVESAFPGPFFNEFVLRLPCDASAACERLAERCIWPGLDLGRFFPDMRDCLLVCVTETQRRGDVEVLAGALAEAVA